ncbi:MAG: O-antigen ligase family protein [Planctomycetota bacterium]
MYLWLQIFLLATGITARLIISSSIAGSGLNLLINIFIWLAFLIYLLEKTFSITDNTSKYRSLKWTPLVLKLLLFIFIILIIAAFLKSSYKFGAFTYLTTWITDIILFYLICQLCIQHPQQITLFITLFLSNALIITLSALYQHFKGLKELVFEIQQNPQLLNAIPAELRNDFWGRIAAAEPFATFIYQNSLGAFLVIVIPLILAIFLFIKKPFLSIAQLLEKDYFWSMIFRLVLLIITTLMFFVLIKTGSKGALVSFIASVIIIFILHLKLSRPVRMILFIGTIVLFLFLFSLTLNIISSSDNPHWTESISSSLKVRFDYWRATVKIIKDNIWGGVGLNQFGSEYLYYKSYQAGETTKAHNDYLQIASEMGLPALIIFILTWFVILKSIIYPQRQQPATTLFTAETQRTPRKPLNISLRLCGKISCYCLGTAFAFIIGVIFQTPLIQSLSTVILYLIWLFIFWSLATYLNPITADNFKSIRIALFAGILGFLLHCTIDFNFYVQGLSMSIWFIGAIFLSTANGTSIIKQVPSGTADLTFPPEADLPPAQGSGKKTTSETNEPPTTNYRPRLKKFIGLSFILLTAFIIIILYLAIPRLIQYESLLEEGKTLLRSNNKEERLSGIEYLQKAHLLNPYAVDPLLELAWAYHYNYCLPAPGKRGLISIDNIGNNNRCLEYITEATDLSRSSPMLYYQGGLLYQEHSEYLSKISKFITDPEKRKAFEKMAELYKQRAELSFLMTKELYPTFKNR